MDYLLLAKKYGTPLYAYDFDYIENQYNRLKKEFNARKSLIAYAVKANSNLSVLKHIAAQGAGFDCVSIGEIKRALIAGAQNYKIIYSGVGKSDEEIEQALNLDILMLNLESEEEMKRVELIAEKLGKIARISVRVNPNVDPKTHPYISTGLSENKFGVSIDKARKMYLYAHKSKFLDPIGIHFHIGSQLTDLSPVVEASNIVSKLLRELKALEIDIKFFDVGGGVGIRYDQENDPDLYAYAQGILSALKGMDVTIICEPGRFLVGNCGVFITKVLYEKTNDAKPESRKRFVIVDGAMNDLIRPSLYEAYHEIDALKEGKGELCDVVGPVCESGDFLGKNISLPKLSSGDILVVKSAGAYGFSMSSNYNSRPRAAEIAIKGGKDRLIRKRENFEDLIQNEKEFI
ncbi:diaminopimelate decarboxylase [Campylobacter hyointestinalis]|uniref:Diaminopimelate decarboxylase n=1 Tax=Campylobacter hyointestinalis TaxID=198 RepID=A0A562X7A0_CAMHY|nr:diaminopimelate decarboxylase [Campylobacter hyointestinalis]RAZ24699.1 diaminopimelate decarboxylase [Campylobacter hyointestinalis subsp. lawsonii]RAZ38977.1 diaminopimelate decarboxylase [Campylobacter hyointestinalis subsp. lawsonii]RAZ52841.1 diaminopimelate decarboxylase [Campylobacter hyointestinalis subsp. lawsonii]RAZ60669.1 diaminopimelate decarboxylase [Campylobacter hyointestinalis subsp. lawsonii]TWO18068.1 diaminopimelate decarboxylase [Campylobacter hyointestinalis]